MFKLPTAVRTANKKGGEGNANIRRCRTKNFENTERDLLDKQRFGSLRTNTRKERVLKWYLERSFVLGRRFVLRVALQGAAVVMRMRWNVPSGSTSQMSQSHRQ